MFSICTPSNFAANFLYLRGNIICQKFLNVKNEWIERQIKVHIFANHFAESLQSFLLFDTFIKNLLWHHALESDTKNGSIPISIDIGAVSFDVFLFYKQYDNRETRKYHLQWQQKMEDSNLI